MESLVYQVLKEKNRITIGGGAILYVFIYIYIWQRHCKVISTTLPTRHRILPLARKQDTCQKSLFTMGSHMSNENSQTSPFVTPPTPIYSNPAHGLRMGTANCGADALEAFHVRQAVATFKGDSGGIAAEGHARLALDLWLQSSGQQFGHCAHYILCRQDPTITFQSTTVARPPI